METVATLVALADNAASWQMGPELASTICGAVDTRKGAMTAQSLLTKRDVASQARVSPRTVDYWMKRGWLPVIKLGSAVRFLPADFQRFIEAHRVK